MRLTIQIILSLATLLGFYPAWAASSLDGLEACGVQGRKFHIPAERAESFVLQSGWYFHVTAMTPAADCGRRDWLFLADRDLRARLSRMLQTRTQIVLRIPEYVGQEDKGFYGAAVRNDQFWGEHLPARSLVILVTPETDAYILTHEQKHLGDFLTIDPLLQMQTDYLMMLGLPARHARVVKEFVLELRAHGEELVKLESATREIEYLINDGVIHDVPGDAYREYMGSKAKEYMRSWYAYPTNTVLRQTQTDQPELYGRVRDLIVQHTPLTYWRATEIGKILPDVYAQACEAQLSEHRPSSSPDRRSP